MPEIGKLDRGVAADLLRDRVGDDDAAGLGVGLQARGDVDAVAEHVVVLEDDLGDMHAHAELDALAGRFVAARLADQRLQVDAEIGRVLRRVEHGEEAVAHVLDDAAVVGADLRLDHLRLELHEATMRIVFVGLHEAAVPRHISEHDRRHLANAQMRSAGPAHRNRLDR